MMGLVWFQIFFSIQVALGLERSLLEIRKDGDCSQKWFSYISENDLNEVKQCLLMWEKDDQTDKINQEDGFDLVTALHTAAGKGYLELVKLLLDNQAKVDITDEYEQTPLHYAASGNYSEVARLLINKGADVNKTDYWGKTALQLAASNGYLKVARLLIENGADVKKTDVFGTTALDLAVSNGHSGIQDLLSNSDGINAKRVEEESLPERDGVREPASTDDMATTLLQYVGIPLGVIAIILATICIICKRTRGKMVQNSLDSED